MRLSWLVCAIVVGGAACGHPAGTAAPPGGATGSEATANPGGLPVVGHDQVCYARVDRYQGKAVAVCAEGLECCYPCGTPGCDSICHTHAECEEDMMRP